jgi:hypothetical protein
MALLHECSGDSLSLFLHKGMEPAYGILEFTASCINLHVDTGKGFWSQNKEIYMNLGSLIIVFPS